MSRVVCKILIICIVVLSTGCVAQRKYDAARAEIMSLQAQLAKREAAALALGLRADEADSLNRSLSLDKRNLQAEAAQLKDDTARLGSNIRAMQKRYSKLLAEGSAEASRMLEELTRSQGELADRARRVAELEQAIAARDNALSDIRSKVADALLGFDGKGLSISRRDGKVYVSMDDKLLFRSGSFDIDPRGAEAVRQLSEVLAANPDININVEGHTDNVPYPGKGLLKDNLDLSVKRATTVTRLLLENKGIDPLRIVSSGRGEYMPLSTDNTAEARARNRRTEIILTPKLDELLKLAN